MKNKPNKNEGNGGHVRVPTNPKPPIPEEQLWSLEARYSAPVKTALDDQSALIWSAAADLKGWIVRGADPHGLRYIAWKKIADTLVGGVEDMNAKVFDEFAKAWAQLEFEKSPTKKNVNSEVNAWDAKLSEEIENLIPTLQKNSPQNARKLKLLDSIYSLQRKLKRAPTRREIEDHSDLNKNDADKLINEMGIAHLLSGRKARSKNILGEG
jgi:hypothetical protein